MRIPLLDSIASHRFRSPAHAWITAGNLGGRSEASWIRVSRTIAPAEENQAPRDPSIGRAFFDSCLVVSIRDAARVGRRRAIAPGHARHTVRELHAEDLFRGVPGVR